ncbi:MAG: 16S rRNA (cytosine(1402)-N(4))-methyltransferase RsmH [Oscillospiraceae bacterium]|nr:16S rRNA (cytosine(1402)-N(4))-methyltransferase RsmH [Oscillospiraceae bacterium]
MAEIGVYHVPIMLNEVLSDLDVKPDGIYLDGTAGGGGHSRAIAERLTQGGMLYAMDQDPDAISEAGKRLAGLPAELIHANFTSLGTVLSGRGVKADGILLDLGVSSHELDEDSRGFSYHRDAPLDMRMSQEGRTAADLVNTLTEDELSRIIFQYGEEKYARQIASQIAAARLNKPVETTLELAELIKKAVPAKVRRDKNPCKKTFQAIRIAVNDELNCLSAALQTAFASLKPGGRLVILTFHSLEDRMVKQAFAEWCRGCICPPEFPVCVCGHKPAGRLVHRKPLTASAEELAANSRSKSAKLRAIEKLAEI